MNYPFPFEPHNTSSDNSRNEFMVHESPISIHSHMMSPNNYSVPNDMQKLFSYMKNVMSNPILMDQMEKFLTAKQSQKNSSSMNKQNQSMSISQVQNDIRMPPNAHILQKSQSQRPQSFKVGPKEQIVYTKTPKIDQNNGAIKKGSSIPSPQIIKQISLNQETSFSAYIPGDKKNKFQLNPNQSQQTKIKTEQKTKFLPSKQSVSFEDMPIKSNYIAGQQFSNFASGPQHLAEYPLNQSQNQKSNPTKIVKQAMLKSNPNAYQNKYIQAEQRPIHGTKKDFKQLIKEQSLESPFDDRPLPTASNMSTNNWIDQKRFQEQENQGDENNQVKKPKREFLKRGTRQYLSSAKDRSSIVKGSKENKDNQQNINNSRYATQKQRDKTQKRDISQNRILSKRNTTNNDKSVSKLKAKDNLNASNNESFYDQTQQQNVKKTITPKNQKVKSPLLPPKNNKLSNNLGKNTHSGVISQGSTKKKNVFDDSSSSDEDIHQKSIHESYETSRTNNLMENNKKSQIKNKQTSSYQPENEYKMFSRQKKDEVIEGVYLTKTQLQLILQKYALSNFNQSSKSTNGNEEKFNQLRKKYTDLCNLLEKQKIDHEQQMEREKEEFENYKQQQVQKIKNQRRVMQRQLKSTMPSQSQNLQKDKEQIQNLKKQLQREKEEHKKKEKTNKILIQKFKKQNEDLKFKLQKLEEQFATSTQMENKFSLLGSDRQTMTSTVNQKANSTITDKSKSKIIGKDISPAKNKLNKTSKAQQSNEQEEQKDEKNYKKTVPLYKTHQDKKLSPPLNQNSKKQQISKNIEESHNSDEDNLPTFKIENKKADQIKTKTQKKYQYVENSAQNNQNTKKQNMPTYAKHNPGFQNKKNVFADDSDQGKSDSQYQQESDQQCDQKSGFFRSQPKYEGLSDLMTANFSIKHVTPQMIENLFRYQTNNDYCKYIQRINNPKRIVVNSSKNGVDKKITNIYNDKSKQILFENGVKKEIFEDGYTIIYFKNGDIKQKLTDGTILYYFNEKKVDQITLINGLNIYRFDNKQVQLHFDGGKYVEIRHPDGTIKTLGSPIN